MIKSVLISIPVLLFTLMLQIAIASRLQLLAGAVDLMLLVLISWSIQNQTKGSWIWTIIGGGLVSYISAMPLMIPLLGYLIINGIVRLFRLRIWQAPILTMLVITFAGTIIQHVIYILALQLLAQIPITFANGLNMVTLPTLLLNLFLAFPVYALIHSLSDWAYPVEIA